MNQRLTASQAEKTKKITMIGLMTAVTCICLLYTSDAADE